MQYIFSKMEEVLMSMNENFTKENNNLNHTKASTSIKMISVLGRTLLHYLELPKEFN